MVGDHHTDVVSGKNAGMKTAFHSGGIGSYGDDVVDFEYSRFGQVVDFIINSG